MRAVTVAAFLAFGSPGPTDAFAQISTYDLARVAHLTPPPTTVDGVEQPELMLTEWSYQIAGTERWTPVAVPRTELPTGGIIPDERAITARAEIMIPADWRDQRIKFRSQANDVAIAGERLKFPREHSEPYEADVTTQVTAGETVSVEIRFRDINPYQVAGLLENALFFAVPPRHVSYVYVTPAFDGKDGSGIARVRYGLTNHSDQAWPAGRLSVGLINPDGSVAENLSVQGDGYESVPAGETAHREMEVTVAAPARWHLEKPQNLTTLTLKTDAAEVATRFGFRELTIVDGEVLLNGQIVKLGGANFEPFPWLMNEDRSQFTLRNWIEGYRDSNASFLRLAHRNKRLIPPTATALADEMGIALQFPLYPITFYGKAPWAKLTAKQKAKQTQDWVDQALEEIAEQFNHPSILIWEIANESDWNDGFAAVHGAVEAFDPSRLRDFTWDREGDNVATNLADWHYPGPRGGERAIHSDRPVIFGEFASEAKVGPMDEHDAGLVPTWGMAHERMWDGMYRGKKCLGGSIWIGNSHYPMDHLIRQIESRQRRDFDKQPSWEELATYLAGSHELLGFGSCLDSWQRPLPGFYNQWKNYCPLRIATVARLEEDAVTLNVENRYHVTDLDEIAVTWRRLDAAGRELERGVGSAEGAPMAGGVARFTPRNEVAAGDEFEVAFTDPQGHEMDRVRVWIDAEPSLRIDWPKAKGARIVRNSASECIVEAGSSRWDFDPSTGQLRSADVGSQRVLSGGTAQGSLDYTIRIDGGGKVTLDYGFTASEAITPRTLGLAFTLPETFRTLVWNLDAYRNDFPEDYVGRPYGVALAIRPGSDGSPDRTDVRPDWGWADDQVILGTMDFCSTKQTFRYAALMNDAGAAVEAVGIGDQAVRSFAYQGETHLVFASSYGGPSSRWPAKQTLRYRSPMEAGETLSDTFRFTLASLPSGVPRRAAETYDDGAMQEQLVRELRSRYRSADGEISTEAVRRIQQASGGKHPISDGYFYPGDGISRDSENGHHHLDRSDLPGAPRRGSLADPRITPLTRVSTGRRSCAGPRRARSGGWVW